MDKQDELFVEFYRLYRTYVSSLCASRVQVSGDGEDLEAIVWYDVHRSFERFQREDPRGLLYRLIVWRAANLHRSYHRDREQLPGEDRLLRHLQPLDSTSPETSPEQQLALQQALSQESPQNREIVWGRYVEQLTWEELAARHQLHRNTVWKRAEATLERLRHCLSYETPAVDGSLP